MDKEVNVSGEDGKLRRFASEFGSKVGVLPSFYLGSALGALFEFVVASNGTEERFCKKLAMSEGRNGLV